MIVLYHNKSRIINIVSNEQDDFSIFKNQYVTVGLLELARKFNDEILVWCHESEKENLNLLKIEELFHHKKLVYSYSPTNYFDSRLGYIEDSPFVKVNKSKKYGTWQMSSRVGAIHASVFNACKEDLIEEKNFDYFLSSFARRAFTNGLLCYSCPQLLLQNAQVKEISYATIYELFKFAKQHYRLRWVFVLFFNLLLFEKKCSLLPFLFSFVYKKRKFNSQCLNQIPLASNKKIIDKGTIDVLIPTIGRKEYLLNVLKNLASQTYLPTNVIIIEQNPDQNSKSDLDFIQNQYWPFTIRQVFTHQTGACNARNIGLSIIESEFTFFADDDIVFDNDLLENAMQTFQSTGNEVFLVACHLQSQSVIPQPPKQFAVFGAGHAFVKTTCLVDLKFDVAYEFGFGEDNDFGMQLRNKGYDILYISTSKILHLKAPIGGFRTKPVLRWQNDKILPKPSPTLMLFRLKYDTKEQLYNYKTTLFFKNLNKSFFLNPIKYIIMFKKKWNRSIFWSNQLLKEQL
jgi:GT2 family glycosyltransferase